MPPFRGLQAGITYIFRMFMNGRAVYIHVHALGLCLTHNGGALVNGRRVEFREEHRVIYINYRMSVVVAFVWLVL